MRVNCIICPVGCEMEIVDNGGEISVKGSKCKRGTVYGVQEYRDPHRTVTSTVRLKSGGVTPVKTSAPVPKGKIFEVLAEIKKIEIFCSVKMGDVIIKNVCNLGVDIIATKSTTI